MKWDLQSVVSSFHVVCLKEGTPSMHSTVDPMFHDAYTRCTVEVWKCRVVWVIHMGVESIFPFTNWVLFGAPLKTGKFNKEEYFKQTAS